MIDRAMLRRTLIDLRVAFDDADAVTTDTLRPARKRELGPALHRRNYAEARGKVTATLDYLVRLAAEDGSEPGAGSPGH